MKRGSILLVLWLATGYEKPHLGVDCCGHLVQWDAREELARLAGDFLAA